MGIEDKIHAEEQVEVFLTLLYKRYGVKEDEIPEIIDNIRWISRSRTGVSRITWHASLALIGLVMMGLFTLVKEGFIHFLKGG